MTGLFGGFYADENALQVLFVTCLLGGGAAWATGRALADSWRPFGQAIVYLLLLGAAVRFAHFALFQGKLFYCALIHFHSSTCRFIRCCNNSDDIETAFNQSF